MGRLVRLPKTRSPLPAVKETIAALHEELELSLNFANAMVREEHYAAAVDVIEEQRKSLIRASDRIGSALRAPEAARKKARSRAMLVGVAAAVTLASGAFAAFRTPVTRPEVRSARIQAIQEAGEALDMAVVISDPVALEAIVVGAQAQLLEAAVGASGDPTVTEHLLTSVGKLTKVIQTNPNLPAPARQRAREVAERVQDIVAVPETIEETDSEPAPEAPAETSDAPSV